MTQTGPTSYPRNNRRLRDRQFRNGHPVILVYRGQHRECILPHDDLSRDWWYCGQLLRPIQLAWTDWGVSGFSRHWPEECFRYGWATHTEQHRVATKPSSRCSGRDSGSRSIRNALHDADRRYQICTYATYGRNDNYSQKCLASVPDQCLQRLQDSPGSPERHHDKYTSFHLLRLQQRKYGKQAVLIP